MGFPWAELVPATVACEVTMSCRCGQILQGTAYMPTPPFKEGYNITINVELCPFDTDKGLLDLALAINKRTWRRNDD